MQRWEYLTIRVEVYSGFTTTTLAPYSMNGQVLNNWKKIPLHQFIGELGAEGWEMTGTISVVGSAEHFLFFKRPLP